MIFFLCRNRNFLICFFRGKIIFFSGLISLFPAHESPLTYLKITQKKKIGLSVKRKLFLNSLKLHSFAFVRNVSTRRLLLRTMLGKIYFKYFLSIFIVKMF